MLSKKDITELINKRRYASLYRYIDHLAYTAAKRRWLYSDSHSGLDAAAIPSHVYQYWYYRLLETTQYHEIEVEPKDRDWLINKLLA